MNRTFTMTLAACVAWVVIMFAAAAPVRAEMTFGWGVPVDQEEVNVDPRFSWTLNLLTPKGERIGSGDQSFAANVSFPAGCMVELLPNVVGIAPGKVEKMAVTLDGGQHWVEARMGPQGWYVPIETKDLPIKGVMYTPVIGIKGPWGDRKIKFFFFTIKTAMGQEAYGHLKFMVKYPQPAQDQMSATELSEYVRGVDWAWSAPNNPANAEAYRKQREEKAQAEAQAALLATLLPCPQCSTSTSQVKHLDGRCPKLYGTGQGTVTTTRLPVATEGSRPGVATSTVTVGAATPLANPVAFMVVSSPTAPPPQQPGYVQVQTNYDPTLQLDPHIPALARQRAVELYKQYQPQPDSGKGMVYLIHFLPDGRPSADFGGQRAIVDVDFWQGNGWVHCDSRYLATSPENERGLLVSPVTPGRYRFRIRGDQFRSFEGEVAAGNALFMFIQKGR